MKLFNLLETACAKLDLKVILHGQGTQETSYAKYIDAITEQSSLKEELEREKNLVNGLEQISMLISLFYPTPPEDNPSYQNLATQLALKRAVVSQLVSLKGQFLCAIQFCIFTGVSDTEITRNSG